MMNLVWVTDAQYVKDYIIELTFNDGIHKKVDLANLLNKRVKLFGPLLDKEVFKAFKLDTWTLTWLDGRLDIAPESLYEMAATAEK